MAANENSKRIARRASNKASKNGAPISEPGMDDALRMWYTELHENHSGNMFRVERALESVQSKFQRIDVLETTGLGKALSLYGSLMVAEGDYNAYNEMLAHVPLFTHPRPHEVLIIGGGDCGCLTNVLKHPEVKRATMCELDRTVVEVSRRHFPKLTSGLGDARARLIFKDGKKFLETAKKKFDVILLDLSDPIGPAADLFQKKFHQRVFESLNDDGIMVAQSESPFFNQRTVRNMHSNLKQVFPLALMYLCHMIIYPSAL
ncbi:MAG: polyamine aminopropyltransferase, partial [Candidatus Zixiibacteriota bacterium]